MQFVVYPYTFTLQHSTGIHHTCLKVILSILHAFIDIILYQLCLFVTASTLPLQAMVFLTGTMVASMLFMQLYSFRNLVILEEIVYLLKAETLMFSVSCLYIYAVGCSYVYFLRIFFAALIFMPLTLTARYFLRALMFRRGFLVKSVLVIGAGRPGEIFAHNISSSPFSLRRIAGFLDNDPQKQGAEFFGVPVLGKIEDLADIEKDLRADEIVIADEMPYRDFVKDCQADVYMLNRPGDEVTKKSMNRASLAVKSLMDYTGAIVALLIFSPVMLWAAYKVRKEDGGTAMFIQDRVGWKAKHFMAYKFRTMKMNAAEITKELFTHPDIFASYKEGIKLKDDPRLTKIGAFLRKSSIDELPQFVNILKGEMSLVGPRPLLQFDVDLLYDARAVKKVYSVKPGITGIWQVSGRSDLDAEFRKEINFWYADNWSIWLDIAILLKTPIAVISKKGAY